jgi:ferredoxin-type protein NapG
VSRADKIQPARRRFLRDVARAAGGLAAVTVTLGLQQQTARAQGVRLRPPGALGEEAFSRACVRCVRCGQCVQACPYDTLKLATLASGLSAGTPYFVARDVPCEMCEDIPCAKVCPSGALDADIESIDEARMGLAVLLDHENCLNFQGLRCDVCYRVCPSIDKAITLELDRNMRTGKHARFLPTVHSAACTGCGKCEKACVLEEAAIKVLPRSLAKGELGHHYRFSWLEGKDG